VARSVVEFFADPANRDVIAQLLRAGVEPRLERRQSVFDGERFVVTGTLERWGRAEVANLLESLGARVTSSVSAQTDYVVVGGKPGSKARRAEELGVTTLDEAAFVTLLQEHGIKID
jgi:DNA ligase (NAD+)